jgi:transcriptional regulator of nitric oxide reductase
MSIEEAPLELTEPQAEFLLAHCYAVEAQVRSSKAIAIVMAIARDTVLRGSSSISHKEHGRRIGACRRSVDDAMKLLKRRDLIERIGTTDLGVSIYRAKFPAGLAAHGLV